jgi:uncharacterized protein YyaL (SSP411 family)
MPNRLQSETSPYLKQHEDNPVDWFPWCDEAFEKAAEEDKPIFLSIGYSTCHWCHVMAHESFEDPEVAEKMNETFVSIKVDREERPDIDHLYMQVCQMMSDSGGWPLTIIMTPEKRPFFAGTYFPKHSHPQRVGLMDIMANVKEVWADDRDQVVSSANQVLVNLVNSNLMPFGDVLKESTLLHAYNVLEAEYDAEHGGFGKAPKFPTPHHFLFLLAFAKRNNQDHAITMVSETLKKMRLSGTYDHVGYGYHRYATDQEWLLPHFEKMLYDQAFLMWANAEAYKTTEDTAFKTVIDEVITYLERDMKSENGLFYAAEDADIEGVEGKFYTWSEEELNEVLNKEDAEWLKAASAIKPEGNFLEEATKKPTNVNIIHFKSQENADAFAKLREPLFEARNKRVLPGCDTKCLTDWNAFLVTAFANVYRHSGDEAYLTRAKELLQSLESCLKIEDQWYHSYSESKASIDAMAMDILSLCMANLAVFEATCETEYLETAKALFERAKSEFWYDQYGAFTVAKDSDDLIVRQKDGYDGAHPSSNSIGYLCAVLLEKYTLEAGYKETYETLIKSFSNQISQYPVAFTFWLYAEEKRLSNEPVACDPKLK